MEMVGRNLQLFVIACVLLLTVVASLAQPTGPDRFVTDLEYTGPESTQPRNDGRFNRDNELGHLLLKNLRFRDLPRMPTWLVKLNSRLPERSAQADFIERKAPSKRDVTVDDLMGLLKSFDQREASDDGVKLPSLRFGRK
ncbi:hypothetical protein NP493_711g02002 [Ridgeia piscesae]|uniref:Uncharacterized protein n=1 Tax=Ridgeia piscesae TaxID=27915 RepID=A0AAD9KS60_RIDPI|nr:hypothetical protein NP493_711g02002 [Ridgeia piscesae]